MTKLMSTQLTSLFTLRWASRGVHAGDLPDSVPDLLAAYGWYADRHDLDAIMRLFEDEATLETPRTQTTLRGRQAIAKLLTSAWAHVPDGAQRRHLITGVRVLGKEEGGVSFSATFGVVGRSEDGAAGVYASGCYEGIAASSGSGLRFRHLIIALD